MIFSIEFVSKFGFISFESFSMSFNKFTAKFSALSYNFIRISSVPWFLFRDVLLDNVLVIFLKKLKISWNMSLKSFKTLSLSRLSLFKCFLLARLSNISLKSED